MKITADHPNIIKEIDMRHQYKANQKNPIFLYGPSRSGKTTVLKMIEDYLFSKKGIKVFRLDAEDIVEELIRSIRKSGDAEGFYYKLHGCDALLIDNIWVLRGRPRTEQEIFNLFKTLIDKGKLVVIASDISPEMLMQRRKTDTELYKHSITFKMKLFNPST